MIARLEGQLFEKTPTRVRRRRRRRRLRGLDPALDLHRAARRREARSRCGVYTHLRENALQLFGFAHRARARRCSSSLLRASRVGPKLALTVLSGLDAAAVLAAIRARNAAALRAISGVGAKLAQRMVVELRDRAGELVAAPAPSRRGGGAPAPRRPRPGRSVLSALVNLRLPRSQAERIVEEVIAERGERGSDRGPACAPRCRGSRDERRRPRRAPRDLRGAAPRRARLRGAALRPRTLAEIVGQDKLRENLGVFVAAARERGEPLDHLLFYGPPGLGKTSLAHIVAREMGAQFRATSGPVLERSGDLAGAALEPRGRRRALHRRDPPPAPAVVEEVPLSGDGGLPPRRPDRPGPDGAVGAARAAALHAGRRDDARGAADARRCATASARRRGSTTTRRRTSSAIARPLGAAPRDRARRAARRRPSRGARAARRASRTACCGACATSPRCAAGAARASTTSSPPSRSSASRSTRRASTGSTGRCCSRCSRSSTAARSASTRSPPPSARTAARSRTSYEPFLIQEGFLERTPRGRLATRRAREHFGVAALARGGRQGSLL